MLGKLVFMDNYAIALAVEEFAKKEMEKKGRHDAAEKSQVHRFKLFLYIN